MKHPHYKIKDSRKHWETQIVMSPTGINRSAAPGEFSRLPAEGGKILVKIIHKWHQLETLGHYSLMEFKGFKNRRGTWHQAKDIRYITLMDVIRYHSSMCVIRLQLLTLRNTSPSSEIQWNQRNATCSDFAPQQRNPKTAPLQLSTTGPRMNMV